MQRVFATLLLVILGFPLMTPLVRADADAKLPSCCRREGKHHCGMANPQERSGAAVREKCPNYSGVSAAPAFSKTAPLNSAQVFFTSIAKYPAVHPQTAALQRIFSRSSQKRGPPVLLS